MDEWRAATEYNGYSSSDPVIVWWWRALKSFNREERAKVLSFATGTSRVPLSGFVDLQGVQGVQRFSIHRAYGASDRLPQAHTCKSHEASLYWKKPLKGACLLQASIKLTYHSIRPTRCFGINCCWLLMKVERVSVSRKQYISWYNPSITSCRSHLIVYTFTSSWYRRNARCQYFVHRSNLQNAPPSSFCSSFCESHQRSSTSTPYENVSEQSGPGYRGTGLPSCGRNIMSLDVVTTTWH